MSRSKRKKKRQSRHSKHSELRNNKKTKLVCRRNRKINLRDRSLLKKLRQHWRQKLRLKRH